MSWKTAAERDRDGIEKSRTQIASERDAVQKKTFTKWINSHLMKNGVKVNDLYEDLRDGKYLQMLLEMFTGVKLKMEKGKMRVHQLTNLNKLMEFLNRQKIDTLNINTTDILDGNPKLTLALVWRLILHYQLSSNTGANVGIAELKQVILEWCRNVTDGYEGVNVTNFTTSWKSGLALNAIINRFRPDLIDYDTLDPENEAGNLENAFDVAEREVGVPKLLDVEDLQMAVPDERSVLTYISFYIKAFPDDIPPRRKGYDPVTEKLTEYEKCARPLRDWVKEQTQLLARLEGEDLPECLDDLAAVDPDKTIPQSDIDAKSEGKAKAESLFAELQELISAKSSELSIADDLHIDVINKAWDELMAALERRKSRVKEHTDRLEAQRKLDDENKQVEDSWEQYDDVAKPLLLWISGKLEKLETSEFPDDVDKMAALLEKMSEERNSLDWKEKPAMKDKAASLFQAFLSLNSSASSPLEFPETLHYDVIEAAWNQLMEGKNKQIEDATAQLSKMKSLRDEKLAQDKADDSWSQYESVASPLMAWIGEKQLQLDDANNATDKEDLEALLQEISSNEDWKDKFSVKRNAEELFRMFQDLNESCPEPVPVKDGLHFDEDVLKAWNKLMADRDDLITALAAKLKRMGQEEAETEEASQLWQQYEAVAAPLLAWIDARQLEIDGLVFPEDLSEMETLVGKMKEERESEEWKNESQSKNSAEELFVAFKKHTVYSSAPVPVKDGLHFFDDVEKAWDKLMQDADRKMSDAQKNVQLLQDEKDSQDKASSSWEAYEATATPLMTWISEQQALSDGLAVPDDLEDLKGLVDELSKKTESAEWKEQSNNKGTAQGHFSDFLDANSKCPTPITIKDGLHYDDDVQKAWDSLFADHNANLKMAQDQLARRLEEDTAKQEKAEESWGKYEAVGRPLSEWISAKDEELQQIDFPDNVQEMQELLDLLSKMKESPPWIQQASELVTAADLFEAFELANAESKTPVSVKEGLHMENDIRPEWENLNRTVEEMQEKARDQLLRLQQKAELDHVLQEVDNCRGSLEDIKDKLDTFQADRGLSETRDNMKITARELRAELEAWSEQYSDVKRLCSEVDKTKEHFTDDVAQSISEVGTFEETADVLLKRINASDDALVLLENVDEVLQVSFGKAFEENFDMLKSKVDKLRDDHTAFATKQGQELAEGLRNPHELEEQVSACTTHWNTLCSLLNSDVATPVEGADQWLQGIEARLEKHSPLLHRSNNVEKNQLAPLKALTDEISSKMTGVLDVAKRGEAVNATDGSLSIKMVAAGLPQRLQVVKQECENRAECVQSEVSSLSQYEADLNSVKNWLAWAEGELDSLRRRHNEPKTIQAQVEHCQKLLSDVLSHEPYVSAVTKLGDESVDIAKRFDSLVDEFRSALEGSTAAKSQTLEKALEEEYRRDDIPIARDAVPTEVAETKQHYDNLLGVFKHRQERLEGRLAKATHVQGLFDKLKAFLGANEQMTLIGETSLLPADVEVLEHHIGEMSSLTKSIEDSYVILDSATSSFEDLDADAEEDEVSATDGDETDAPGLLTTLGNALKSLRDKSAAGLLQLRSLKDQLADYDDTCAQLSTNLAGIDAQMQTDQTASCDSDVLDMQIQHTSDLVAKVQSQAELVTKAKAMCEALLSRKDVEPASKESLQQKLEGLEEWYNKFVSLSTLRLNQLDKTKACLSRFSDLHKAFCEWLGDTEVKMAVQNTVSVHLAQLEEQIKDAKAFNDQVDAKKPDLDELVIAGKELIATSNETASDLYKQQQELTDTGKAAGQDDDRSDSDSSATAAACVSASTDTASSLDDTPDNWVEAACLSVPTRYHALCARAESRSAAVNKMHADVKKYSGEKQDLDKWMDETDAELGEIESSNTVDVGVDVGTLEENLSKVQGIIANLDEREDGKDSTLGSAEEILTDYRALLADAQDAIKALPSASADVLENAELDVASQGAATDLQQNTEATKENWSALRQRAACLEGNLSTQLGLLKDATGVADELVKSVEDLLARVNGLEPISSDRQQYAVQEKETENLQQELAKLQSQFSALDGAAETSNDIAKTRDAAQQRCDEMEQQLADRLAAFAACGGLLSDDESMNTWIEEQDNVFNELPSTPTRQALELLSKQIRDEKEKLDKLLSTRGDVCQEFEAHVDGNGYEKRVNGTKEKFDKLQAKIHGLFSDLEGREGICECHENINNQLEQYMSWLEDLQKEDCGKIGLRTAEINAVCQKREDQHSRLVDKVKELNDFQASGVLDSLSTEDVLHGENAITNAAGIAAKFADALEAAKVASDRACDAGKVAAVFETPFEQLVALLCDYESQVESAEPVTGDVEITQEQLERFTALLKEISEKCPHVKEVCGQGDQLRDISEVGEEEKEEFGRTVEDVRERWGKLLAGVTVVQEKYSNAAELTRQFLDQHLSPMTSWMNDVEPMLSDNYAIGGDATALAALQEKFDTLAAEMKAKEGDYVATVSTGETLMSEVLDDKTLTAEQLEELTHRWKCCNEKLQKQLQRLADAKEKLAEFVQLLPEVEEMLDEALDKIESMEAVSHTDLATAEAQEQEMEEFSSNDVPACTEAVANCLELCQVLIDSSPEDRQDDLIAVHADLSAKLASLHEVSDSRKLELKAALLELRGLADTIELLEASLDDAEKELSDLEKSCGNEQAKKKSEIQRLQNRLAKLRKELAEVQPELEALVKVKEQRRKADAEAFAQNPQMQTVGVMENQFTALMNRSLQLSADLEDAMTAAVMLEDADFDVEDWRLGFVGWLDENDINVATIFRALDTDNSDELSRNELFEGLATCGFAMKPQHIDQVLDHFDKDDNGSVDKWEFLMGLRPERKVQFAREARTDNERIDHAVRTAVSRCTCSKQFRLEQINAFTYRFGESQLKRMVRILRTNVMVRVGGGWEDLNVFLNKHDPCRATGRTNLDLRKLPRPGHVDDLRKVVKGEGPAQHGRKISTSSTGTRKVSVGHGDGRSHGHDHPPGACAQHDHTSTAAAAPGRKHAMVTRSQQPDKKLSTERKPVTSSGYGISSSRSAKPTAAKSKDVPDGSSTTARKTSSGTPVSTSRPSTMRKTTSASSVASSKKSLDVSTTPAKKTSDTTKPSTGYRNVSSSGYGRPGRVSHDKTKRVSSGDEPGKTTVATASPRAARLSASARPKTTSSSSPKTVSKAPPSPRVQHQASPALTVPRAGHFANPTIASSEKVRSRSPSVSPEVSPQLSRKTEEIHPESRLMMPTQSSLNKTSPKITRKAPPAGAVSPEMESNGTLAMSPTSSVTPLGRAGSGGSDNPTSSSSQS